MKSKELFGELRSKLNPANGEIDLGNVLAEIAQLPLEMAEEVKDMVLPYVISEITQKKVMDTYLNGDVVVRLMNLYPELISDLPTKLKVSDMGTFHSLIELLNEEMLPNLSSLFIFDVPIGRDGISKLTGVTQFKKLTELIIAHGHLGDYGAIDLSNKISEEHEIKLKLPRNGISENVYNSYLKKWMEALGEQEIDFFALKSPIVKALIIEKEAVGITEEENIQLNAWNLYGSYKTARNLYIKKCTFGISEEENIQLNAWNLYPTCEDARALHIKKCTTGLSKEEEERLQSLVLFSRQNRIKIENEY